MKRTIIYSTTLLLVITMMAVLFTNSCSSKTRKYLGGVSIGNGGLRYVQGSHIYNPKTDKKLITDIDWIYESDDTIGIIAKDGKRGYINLNTAEYIVPLEYHKAWTYACNRGCMTRNDTLFIFDRKGQLLAQYHYDDEYQRVFYKNYLTIRLAENQVGLIDTACQWVLDPVYASINYESAGYGRNQKTFWNIRKDDQCLLLNLRLDTVLYGDFDNLDVDWSEGIIATAHNGMQHLYSYTGELLYEQIYADIEVAYYDSGKKDRNGDAIMEESSCYIYSNYDGKKGLMNRHYHPITAPMFHNLETRGQHLFFATFGEYNDRFGTLIDDQGRPVR